MEYVLETNGLCKRYRDFTALNGLDMHIPKGSIYGFVGRNGAGKTTLIRLICGLQQPTGGGFTLYGVKNTDNRISRCRRRMGAVVEAARSSTGLGLSIARLLTEKLGGTITAEYKNGRLHICAAFPQR